MPLKTVVFGLLLGLSLVACGTAPRGSGLQSEVLAHADKTVAPASADPNEPAVPAEFAVEPITRDSLARYALWPAVGEKSLPWITRVDQPNNRIIAPSDSVTITIWNTEDNSLFGEGQRTVTLPPNQVGPDGKIFLPYIGQLKISGMSVEHARSTVGEAYSKVMASAQVQLTLAEGRQSTVSVVGGVGNPGIYPLADQDVTLLDLLAVAGGVTSGLANPQIRVQRGDRTYGTSVAQLMGDTALNTTLRGGDRVFVEAEKRYFLSLGASGSQSQHIFPRDQVTALDAMSLIGGLEAARANAQGILVLRAYPQSAVRRDGSGPRHVRTIFTLDLTSADGLFSAGAFQIRPGDLIYVTESPLIGNRTVLGLIGQAFGLGRQAIILNNNL